MQLRHAVDDVAAGTGLLSAMWSRLRGRFVILMYHRVLPDDACEMYPLTNLVTPLSVFQAQVEYLMRNAVVCTIADAIAASGRPTSRPRVCITFDDGYWDNAELAVPALDRAGARATFYLATDFVEKRVPLWFDIAALAWVREPALAGRIASQTLGTMPGSLDDWLGALKNDAVARAAAVTALRDQAETDLQPPLNRAMTIEQAGAIARGGHEIGAHSRSHPILTELTDERLRDEIAGSLALVRSWSGRELIGFSYPNGSHDERVRAAAVALGAAHAVTTVRGHCGSSSDRFRLERRAMFPASVLRCGAHDANAFHAELVGFHDAQRAVAKVARRLIGRGA